MVEWKESKGAGASAAVSADVYGCEVVIRISPGEELPYQILIEGKPHPGRHRTLGGAKHEAVNYVMSRRNL